MLITRDEDGTKEFKRSVETLEGSRDGRIEQFMTV